MNFTISHSFHIFNRQRFFDLKAISIMACTFNIISKHSKYNFFLLLNNQVKTFYTL